MVLTDKQVAEKVEELIGYRKAEATRLNRIFLYLRDPEPDSNLGRVGWDSDGPLRWLPADIPKDVKRLAEISRVNMLKFVVNSSVQVMYVDGFRAPKGVEEEPTWGTWQLNRMDARQIGIHRAALTYGASYATVLPGEPVSAIRGVSPRRMTAVYDGDDDWPQYALEKRRSAKKDTDLYRLFTNTHSYWVEVSDGSGSDDGKISLLSEEEHNSGVVPVVRFRTTVDNDVDDVEGEVEGLIPLQDQINITTFSLLVAQHYGAFRQRYIMGWMGDSEQQTAQASARKLWTFEDPDTKVGEFGQTNLDGYLDSREASLRHLATISQTPAHELLGQLVNLSAEALAAAESSHRRKISERQVVMGEAWEQVLELAGKNDGQTSDPNAYVRWRDTEARSLAQMADALGKLVTMLGVPPQELWERVPGVSQDEVERWKAAAASGDAFAGLERMLKAQSEPAPEAPVEDG